MVDWERERGRGVGRGIGNVVRSFGVSTFDGNVERVGGLKIVVFGIGSSGVGIHEVDALEVGVLEVGVLEVGVLEVGVLEAV